MKHFSLALLLLVAPVIADQSESALTVRGLECEDRVNPDGVADATPTLGWQLAGSGRGLRQKAYRVLAATSAEKLTAGQGDLWDSGEVDTHASQNITYRGEELKSGQKVHWKVRVKDQDEKWTAWSDPATFTFSPAVTAKSPLPLLTAEGRAISSFESSSEALNKLFAAAPEKLGEIKTLRDTNLALRAALYHRDFLPRANAWLDLLNASTTDQDHYPGSLPPKTEPGSLNSDAGILSTHIIWLMSGDLDQLKDHWKTMHKYLTARKKIDPDFSGRPFGELPAGTLPEGDKTPPGLVHTAAHGLVYRIMVELSRTAAETPFETPILENGYKNLREQFQKRYLNKKNELTVESPVAQLITLRYGLLSTDEQKKAVSEQFLRNFRKQDPKEAFRQGPLAAHALLPVLTWTGNHDLAVEVVEKQSPEELSPVALAAISEWLIWMVGGIDTQGPGFQNVRLAPYIPSAEVLKFAKASHESQYGLVRSHWHYEDDGLHYEVSLPPNTFATVLLPAAEGATVTEGGKPLAEVDEVVRQSQEGDLRVLQILPGSYHFLISAP